MIRSEMLKNLIPIISDQLVVSNIGLPSQELHMLDDRAIFICSEQWASPRQSGLAWHWHNLPT